MKQTTEMKILEELENFIEVKAMKAVQNSFSSKGAKNRVWKSGYDGERQALSAIREEIQRLKEENN